MGLLLTGMPLPSDVQRAEACTQVSLQPWGLSALVLRCVRSIMTTVFTSSLCVSCSAGCHSSRLFASQQLQCTLQVSAAMRGTTVLTSAGQILLRCAVWLSQPAKPPVGSWFAVLTPGLDAEELLPGLLLHDCMIATNPAIHSAARSASSCLKLCLIMVSTRNVYLSKHFVPMDCTDCTGCIGSLYSLLVIVYLPEQCRGQCNSVLARAFCISCTNRHM